MKTKKMIKSTFLIVFILIFLTLLFLYISYPKYSETAKWMQEYIVGAGNIQGEVNLEEYGSNPAYEIGADKDGYAVFKNPDKAFKQMKKDYSLGLAFLQKEFNMLSINRFNFHKYDRTEDFIRDEKTDQRTKDQIFKIAKFIDIYENSFRK